MKIQYFHRRNYNKFNKLIARGGVTLAMGLSGLSWKTFTNMTCGETISIPVGIAICSPDDMYCKATGRKLCLERLAHRTFTYIDINFAPNTDNKIARVVLENGGVQFILHLSEDSVRFVYCE